MEGDHTRRLAAFAARLEHDDLPADIVDVLKRSLLDVIACAIHGATTPWARAVTSVIVAHAGSPEARLWRHDWSCPAGQAALGIGVMAHAFELDDYHAAAKLHPGAPVVPAALAVAEREHASGRDLLAALAAGYEVVIRAGMAANPISVRRRGFHVTGACGPFGASAAAGRLMGLDDAAMAHALGLAGTQAGGLMAFTCNGADSKRLHPGRAAESGVLAAELAAAGFTGPTAIFEYPDGGFCAAFSDEPVLSALTKDLGRTFFCREVAIKVYASCASTHSSIDVIRMLRKTHGLSPPDVKRIVVKNHSMVRRQCGWRYEPKTAIQAQMNMGYCLAVALRDDNVGPDAFSDENIADPQLIDLAQRVTVEGDSEIEQIYPQAFPTRVAVYLHDGRCLQHAVSGPRGSPQDPMTFDDVTQKSHELMDPILGQHGVEAVVDQVIHLETLEDVAQLTEILR